jgi:hypothetical protein
MLRTGKAGSNTAADHIEVLTEAIAQIPAKHRKRLLIRSDGAGASHKLLEWLHEQGKVRGRTVEYSVGFALTSARLSPRPRRTCGHRRLRPAATCARALTSRS